ncbi:ribosomal protein S18 acetylase RimI-like enzyme [Allocatelliglobosispora scoriae]|uniref:Ribosomal protein S18 acetylase RimI-like enzyme n=1 Tax=Allocatelliglobosispora scoriae TaxID=643052 RepID=A0A841BJX3_9ACTN|nr:GNAT family N-acetyltransferase [Allocatelliglobosispora scoriae]MBB5867120.1 ribosomal protein S18 acetylase RimI-like enzyme [Allocatelliglobosispora scoriae]
MNDAVTTEWPGHADEALLAECHRVVAAVVGLGGAVGWLDVPDRSDVDAWLLGVVDRVAAGTAGLLVVRAAGRVEGLGTWVANPPGTKAVVTDLQRIMVHPDARGLGLGRILVDLLTGAALGAGAEVVTLAVRGNNHGAVALYEACGFRIWGVLPGGVAVGDERYDDVRMYRAAPLPDHLVRHGSNPTGLGSSAVRS